MKKKIKKFNFILEKKFFFEKLYFSIKITYFLVLGPYNYFLGVFWPKNLIFRRFHLDMHISRSLLWLPYKRDFAPNRFKWSGIANWKMSENFVGLSLTVWQIWPEKWQKRGVLSQLERSTKIIRTVFLNFSLHISPYSYLFLIRNASIIPRKIYFPQICAQKCPGKLFVYYNVFFTFWWSVRIWGGKIHIFQ